MEETAYHESGHVFVAHHLGGTIHHVTIDPEYDDRPARFGDVEVEWQRRFESAKERIIVQTQVALAGPAAEMVYTGEPLHPAFVQEWASDWQTALELCRPLFSDPKKRITELEHVCVQLFQLFSKDHVWARVAALADELLAHETLENEQIVEVLGFWERHFDI